jgi:nitroimidazol reductase NimA-like FMN-containing flavoprotein (pyridoxamine 5'-phosphate oxidase superfamily)
MRRKDKEISDFKEILNLVENADTMHLALYDSDYPYIIPLSYGYEEIDNTLVFYFHGSKKGKKNDLINTDNRVCIEINTFDKYIPTGSSVTCLYSSLIGFGHVFKVEGLDAKHGLDLILTHCGFKDFKYTEACFNGANVYKIVLDKITGKKSTQDMFL